MAVREKTCSKTNATFFEASVNVRSKVDCTLRVQRYKKCKTLKEAQKEERKLLKHALETLAREEARGNNWVRVIDLWEAEATQFGRNPITGKEITPKTIRDSVNMLKSWTKDWLMVPAKEVNKAHGRIILRTAINKGLKKCSIRKIKNTIQTVYDFGIQEGVINGVSHSPVYGISIELPSEEKLPEILTVEEVKKLLIEARSRSHEWYHVWALALMTGMRSGELYALRKENINLKTNLIRITEAWDWHTDKAKSTKAKYWRNAPIASNLKSVIEELYELYPKSEFLLPRLPEWKKGEQARVLRAFCDKIGITSVKFHTLRACFATHLLASGTNEATVMRIGGWRNFKTFQIYVRLAGVKEQGATEGLATAFLPSDEAIISHISKAYSAA